MIPLDKIAEVMKKSPHPDPAFQSMLVYMRLCVPGFLLLSLTALISAIGLLFRKNWARLLFVGISAVAIAYNIVEGIIPLVRPVRPAAFPQANPHFRLWLDVFRVFTIGVSVASVVLFIWIIKRLVSKPVKEEFVFNRDSNATE